VSNCIAISKLEKDVENESGTVKKITKEEGGGRKA
jgi:hypothetical protein